MSEQLMKKPMKVAIVTALWYEDAYLAELFASIEKMEYPRESVEVIMIDNKNSPKTREWLQTNVLPKAGKTLPNFHLIETEINTGYAGGNNACMRRALELGVDAVYLLNEDAHGEPGFLMEAVRLLENDPKVGAVQSFLVLDPDGTMNSVGNAVHFLGFGYCDGYKVNRYDAEGYMRVEALTKSRHEIGYASGAAVLYRAEVLKKVGLLDASYFMYHEDLDLSWRIREVGYTVELAPLSVVHHKYEFKRSIEKFYWMERNRYRFMLEHWRHGTLVLLFPAFIASEAALFLIAILRGGTRERVRAWIWILNPRNWKEIGIKRESVFLLRELDDKTLIQYLVPSILFQDLNSPFLRYLNPLMGAYWALVRRCIFW